MIQAVVNLLYPNRVALYLGQITGPLVSVTTGMFDPRKSLAVFVNGVPAPILAYEFDSFNNRYLLFLGQQLQAADMVQVVHSMPESVFSGQTGVSYAQRGFGVAFGEDL